MTYRRIFVAAFLAAAARFSPAAAQSVETVTVTGDAVHLIATAPDDTALGLSKPLLETPRAVTLVSDVTMARYGVQGIDDLTAITPNAYTASFYGVEGAVNLRGTLAENYFRGFKRVENRGTYDTPLSDAGQIAILRGPPPSAFGAGKVGGLVDFIPKRDADGGEAAITYGSYAKRALSAGFGAPLNLGFAEGRGHLYGEIDDSFSFYRGLHPSHQMLQASVILARDAWTLSGDYMFFHANGEIQTPGWNRLTQALIDSGTYVTGRDASLKDADGNGRLTLNELGGNPYAFDPRFQPLYQVVPFCGACSDAAHSLDTGLGVTHLSPRTIYLARGVDFSNTVTHTGLLELGRTLPGGDTLKLQAFVDTLANDRFVSYGFPGSYRTQIGEARLRYDFNRADGKFAFEGAMGGSYRYVHAVAKESFNSGIIALDRRDISAGPAANDIIDSPFTPDPAGAIGLGWENDVRSNTSDAGLFGIGDLNWDGRVDLVLSGRYDAYTVRSVDVGALAFEPGAGRGAKGSLTYSASLTYKTDWGLVPYFSHAKAAALEIGQASQVATALLANGDWLSSSVLDEGGVKFSFLDAHLTGSLDFYAQSRTQLLEGPTISVMGTRAKGTELEVRYVLDEHWSMTFAGSLQHTMVKGPDHSFAYLPARSAGVTPAAGFGGTYVTFDFSTIRPGNYEYSLIPHAVFSPYLTYSGGNWGASLGARYASHTAQTVPGAIVFPAYATLHASAFARLEDWTAQLNIDNLANQRFFTPGADTYANLSALPGQGRTWRVTLRHSF